MYKRRLWHIVALLTALFFAVGCAVDDDIDNTLNPPAEGKYDFWYFGQEEVPVNSVVVSDNDWFRLVVLSPLVDMSNLTTNLIIGIQHAHLGKRLDVERMLHNYDYLVTYEDPQCYYAPYRELRSGTIYMSQEGDKLMLDVDVVLYDGTPLRYTNYNILVE